MASLNQLQYIVSVDKNRHFGKAAEQCNIAQPTLSMQIQKVEEEIGYPIFDRSKKPVMPTAKGQRYIEQAKVLLREHQKLIDLSSRQAGEVGGEFRLGVIPTIAPYLLPLFIQPFSQAHAKIHLSIDEMKTSDIIRQLHEDTLDAGLVATPLHEKGLFERPLYYEPFYLYVAKSHPLNARKRINENDLHSDEMWLLQDGHCLRSQIARFCSIKPGDGVFANVEFEGGNLDTLRQLIRKSTGYTLVPRLFVETLSEAERRDFVREFEKPIPTREVSLVYRRDHWKADILLALQESITAKLPAELRAHDQKRQEILRAD